MSLVLPISQHQLLGSDDCASITNRVHALREHWTQRSGNGFFSLGAAAYLDGRESYERYLAAAAATNAVLLNDFNDLYKIVLGFFRAFLDEDVCLDTRCAVPGFHVFIMRGADRRGDDPARRAHFDMQWQLAYPDKQPEATLSFTLVVELPVGGASMAIWPTRLGDLTGDRVSAFLARRPPQTIPYLLGSLIVHDGMTLHAIGSPRDAWASGNRVTLQGHGIRTGGCWCLYW